LGIVIVPPGVTTPTAFPDSGFLTHTMEVAGSTCLEVPIPYLYLTPFRKTSIITTQTSITTTETRVVIFELTPPTGQSGTVVRPPINIYMRGSDKLSLGIPSLDIINNYKYTPQGLGMQSVATFGEEIEDIHLLMKRPVVQYTTDRDYFTVPVLPAPPNDTFVMDANLNLSSTYTTSFSWVTVFTPLYWGNMGGVTHRFADSSTTINKFRTMYAVNTQLLTGTLPAPDTTRGNNFKSSRGMQVVAEDYDGILGVRVPDRNPYQFRHPNIQLTTNEVLECVTIFAPSPDGRTEGVNLVSAADDFQVGGYLCIPTWYPRVGASTESLRVVIPKSELVELDLVDTPIPELPEELTESSSAHATGTYVSIENALKESLSAVKEETDSDIGIQPPEWTLTSEEDSRTGEFSYDTHIL